ncbi:hypothetical protein [Mucilaginibacter sp. PAMB04168]|uniref:hypothetical protein n=1 Tax=Mucilaginibacter sp. PAMB04168 TaxID=3138567 RepID=UPI0031F6E9E5
MKLFYKAPMVCAMLLGAAVMLSTGCKSYNDLAGHYSSKHIKANTNQVTAQIPETGELGYILLSLTETGSNDTTLINKESAYYKDVMKQFAAFKNHKAVKLLNSDLLANGNNFSHFRNGLYAYKFNKHNNMVLKTEYRVDLNRVDFRRYVGAIEDFIEKTNFRSFYAEHNNLYTKIIKEQGQQLNMNAAWATMGKQYTQPFQSYQVILSPLMKGSASTLAVSGRGFRECLIFAESTNKALFYSSTTASTPKVAYND